MKILFSLTYYTPYSSGLTLYVKRLGEALVKKGYSVTVLIMNFDKRCRSAEIVNEVKVVRADYFFKISKGFVSLDWILKSWREVGRNDIVIISLPQFEGFIPALLAKLLRRKVISIYHCEVVLPSGLLNSLAQIVLTLSNFFTLAISDKVVTYTEDFADHSKLLPHFRNKLQFIYPPIIKPKTDKRVQKILRSKLPHPNPLLIGEGNGVRSTFIIGVAARLAAEKGIEYLLESIPAIKSTLKHYVIPSEARDLSTSLSSHSREIPPRTSFGRNDNFKILIAGSMEPVGEGNYKRKILKLVEKYKNYVIFLGELKEEEMGSFYSLLDVLILPSVNSTEAFGMVQVEAMLMGVPVVATDLPGVRIPIQKTGMGLLVPIRNSQKLAEAIVEILIHKQKYIKDTSLIKKEFSFEETIGFYQKLL